MNFSYYVFAFFVFVLVALIVLLVKKVKGAEAEAKKAIDEKEKNCLSSIKAWKT